MRQLDAVTLDVSGERAQRAEDAHVVLVVRAQLEAVALGDLQRQLQRVDRIQTQAGLEQRRLRIDVRRRDAFEIQCGDDEFGKLALAGRLKC